MKLAKAACSYVRGHACVRSHLRIQLGPLRAHLRPQEVAVRLALGLVEGLEGADGVVLGLLKRTQTRVTES